MDAEDCAPILSVKDTIATIRLSRPAKANRLEADDLAELMRHFAAVDRDPAVRVVVLTGTGRHFCAGYDMSGFEDMAPLAGQPGPNPFEAVVNALAAVGKPVICAINGGMYGGAIDLALACDHRVAVARTRARMPALALGFQYYLDGLRRYVAIVGERATRRIFFDASEMSSEELLSLGVIDACVPDDAALAQATQRKALAWQALAPLAVAGTKQVLLALRAAEVDEARLRLTERRILASEDFREGRQAWFEKRTPIFRGC